ncbi:MAG: serine/threonine-protein kinase, partial [Verrucomicrobiota bacterium]
MGETTTEFGRYEILGEIARGAMSVVYRARQRGLDRIVALKILQGGATASAEQLQRFMQEAHAAARIQHPNIVLIHDFGTQNGQHYFTMDYIAGGSLSDRLAKGPIPPREALEIVRQTANALQHAHERNVVHRDIKPGNILLDANGHVHVTDFGIAKEMDHTEMHLTATGQIIGTPQYMS